MSLITVLLASGPRLVQAKLNGEKRCGLAPKQLPKSPTRDCRSTPHNSLTLKSRDAEQGRI